MAKATLVGALALTMWFMWSSRDFVAAAYSTTSDSEEIRLSGIDLEIQKTPIGESPFAIRTAEDARRKPMAVLFTEDEIEEEVVIEMDNGAATIQGSAVTPDGPAFGGVVRLERHTVDGIGRIDTRVSEGGGWGLDTLPGGRYRVRAWVPGLATMANSEVFFIEDDGVVTLDFELQSVDPEPILEFVDGGTMYEGLTGTVGVGVSQRVVDSNGLILTTPVVGATISIQTSAEMSSVSGQSALTDQDGVARFTLRCNRAGTGAINVRYGLLVQSYSLPACREIPPPPTLPPTTVRRSTVRQTTAQSTTIAPTSTTRKTTTAKTSNDGSGQ